GQDDVRRVEVRQGDPGEIREDPQAVDHEVAVDEPQAAGELGDAVGQPVLPARRSSAWRCASSARMLRSTTWAMPERGGPSPAVGFIRMRFPPSL
ncbi:MAG: hypothetical protein M3361_14955, partial [Candidatus Tectomicrobia bacterium]|nr:hypothetical protein [Candidatus Tectomicrobia bacterium]